MMISYVIISCFLTCHHSMILSHVIIYCFMACHHSMILSNVIIPCYNSMLSTYNITPSAAYASLYYHPILSHDVVITYYHPTLHDTASPNSITCYPMLSSDVIAQVITAPILIIPGNDLNQCLRFYFENSDSDFLLVKPNIPANSELVNSFNSY
jgi:hypothetical protein